MCLSYYIFSYPYVMMELILLAATVGFGTAAAISYRKETHFRIHSFDGDNQLSKFIRHNLYRRKRLGCRIPDECNKLFHTPSHKWSSESIQVALNFLGAIDNPLLNMDDCASLDLNILSP